jgi:hypothetical protein
MTSRRSSSSKVVLTQGSARSSSDSLSSRSSSSKSSTYSNYGYSTYGSSATSDMGRSSYSEKASSRPRESYLRVPDARRMAHTPDTFSPHANSIPATASKDGITKISRGTVEVINQEKRREDRHEPRSSDAKSSDYNKSSSTRKPKK